MRLPRAALDGSARDLLQEEEMPQRSTLATLATPSRGACALGFRRAMAGPLQVAALVAAGVTTLACTGLCASAARGASEGASASATSLTASALAWGAGVALAATGASRAWHRDRDDGVFGLARARGTSPTAYAASRTVGLAALLAAVVGGGTLVAGLVGVAASPAKNALAAFAGLGAPLAFAAAYAVVLASVALAALGARTRMGGYLALVALLVVPDVVARGLGDALPVSARDVLSIPGALVALRSGLDAMSSDGVDLLRAARGAFVLAVVVALAFAFSVRDVRRAETEAPS